MTHPLDHDPQITNVFRMMLGHVDGVVAGRLLANNFTFVSLEEPNWRRLDRRSKDAIATVLKGMQGNAQMRVRINNFLSDFKCRPLKAAVAAADAPA